MDKKQEDSCPPQNDNVAEGKTNMDLDETPGRVDTPKSKTVKTDTLTTANQDEEEDTEDVNYKLYNEDGTEKGDATQNK